MSISPKIYCEHCGYQFKVFSKQVETYEDYEPYMETRYYPLESENAHMIGSYICDDCYKKFPQIIKEQLIKSAEEYISGIDYEYKKAEEEYLCKINSIKEKEHNVKKVIKALIETKNFLDLPEGIKEFIDNGNPYLTGKYYLDKVIQWEKENNLKQKQVQQWEKEFELNIEQYPEGKGWGVWVTREEFIDMLLYCRVSNKTPIELLEIVKKG